MDPDFRASYPHGFPDGSQARVETAKIKAGKIFADLKGKLVPSNRYDRQELEVTRYLLGFVLHVWLVFAREACNLGLSRKWTVVQVRKSIDKFLGEIAKEIWWQKGFDLHGKEIEGVVYHDGLLDKFKRIVQDFEQWRQYEEMLLEVAELQSSDPPNTRAKDVGKGTRRGYRTEVRAWMKNHHITSVREAARELAVGESTLKSIMTTRGDVRYGAETLERVLAKILPAGE